MQLMKKMFAVLAVSGVSLFSTLAAEAAVYTPVSNVLPGVVVTPNSFVQSWFVNGANAPANQSIGTVETFLENLAPGLLGDITQVGGANYNTAGFLSIGPNAAASSFAGNVFAVHTGAGEFIYAFASMVNAFSIMMPNGNISSLTGGLVKCGHHSSSGCGTGLSNIRVFVSDKLIGERDPDPVPLPGALVMLVSALGGMRIVRRFAKA